MSYASFKPTLWATGVEHNFPKLNVFAGLANRAFEGEVKYGNQIVINSIGEVTVNDYTGTVNYEDLDDFALSMNIDQKKYFGVNIPDIDKVQSKPDLMKAAQEEIGKSIANNPDEYMAGLYAQAGLESGSTGSPVSITSANIISTLGTVRDKLKDNRVRDGLVAVLPPWMLTKIDYGRIQKDTNNSAILTAGYKGSFMGFDIYESDNISHSGTSWYAPMFFSRAKTFGFAMQLQEVEAGRKESSFTDYLRGLMVYGAKVYRPDSLCTLYCANGSETGL